MIETSFPYIRLLILLILLLLNHLLHLPLQLLLHSLRINSHRLRHVPRLVNANHSLCQVEHVVAERDYDELAVSGLLPNILAHNRHILVIQRRIDLVHAVEWRRLVEVQGEDEGERGQCLLAA